MKSFAAVWTPDEKPDRLPPVLTTALHRVSADPEPAILRATAHWMVGTAGAPAEQMVRRDSSSILAASLDNGSLTELSDGLVPRRGRLTISSRIPGVFAFARLSTANEQLTAGSSRPTPLPIFYSRTSGGEIVVASDALLCALIRAALSGTEVHLSSEYARDLLSWGYALSGRTPFTGVSQVRPTEYLVVMDGQIHRRERLSLDDFDLDESTEEDKARLMADSLAASAERLPRDQSTLLRLSGGKDSRVLIAALHAVGAPVVTETRGADSDLEVAVAAEVARQAGFRHSVTDTDLAVPGDLRSSALTTIARTGGLVPSEPHHAVFTGASPEFPDQWLIMGHSHIQRGGFARTMQNRRDLTWQTLTSQCTTMVHPDLQSAAEHQVRDWLARSTFVTHADPLYEYHVQHRASSYLAPHYRDYSTEATLNYPMVSHEFTAICDALTMFDRVSERVVFRAAELLSPDIMAVPLTDDLWRFDKSGPGQISPERFAERTTPFPAPKITRDRSRPASYSPLSPASLADVVQRLLVEPAFPQLRPFLHPDFLRIIGEKDVRAAIDRYASEQGPRAAGNLRKFIWRAYAAVLWLSGDWLSIDEA